MFFLNFVPAIKDSKNVFEDAIAFRSTCYLFYEGGPALVGKQYQQLHAVDSFHSRKLENFKWFQIATVFLIFN